MASGLVSWAWAGAWPAVVRTQAVDGREEWETVLMAHEEDCSLVTERTKRKRGRARR